MEQTMVAITGGRRSSDVLGRYYTKFDIGNLLISQMTDLTPRRVLDLGVGAGSLSRAVLRRWSDVELLTVDVDVNVRPQLHSPGHPLMGNRHSHIRADALSERLPKLLARRMHSIDTAVCNPPFITPKWRGGFGKIIEDAGFSGCLNVLSDVDGALLFLAQNLRLLANHATLGIIVPDSLISASKYRIFRRELLTRYVVRKAIRLPRHSFIGTDAQAYILIVSKANSGSDRVPLHKFDLGSELSEELLVGIDDGIDRLDFDYHANKGLAHSEFSSSRQVSLSDVCVDIKRGTLSSAEARGHTAPVFHTTDMLADSFGKWMNLHKFGGAPVAMSESRSLIFAQPGDILLARVGRNLESKILGVEEGFPVLSDCVYRIRVPLNCQQSVLLQLSAPAGQAWLKSRAYGVSARQLSKTDLLTFPLSFDR